MPGWPSRPNICETNKSAVARKSVYFIAWKKPPSVAAESSPRRVHMEGNAWSDHFDSPDLASFNQERLSEGQHHSRNKNGCGWQSESHPVSLRNSLGFYSIFPLTLSTVAVALFPAGF